MTLALRASLVSLLTLAGTPAAAAVQPGQPAPAFEGTPLNGGMPIRLADYRGKVVYLDFWASWCGPCKLSLPWMEQLRKDFGQSGLEVIAVNVDEKPEDAAAFLSRFPVSYPVATDGGGAVATLYDVQDMPSSYLIDRRGVVRRVHGGFSRPDGERLREAVARLVKEQP